MQLPADRIRDLDAVIARANALMKDNYAEAIRILGTFHIPIQCPAGLDPHSEEYLRWVGTMHSQVSHFKHYDPRECEQDPNVDRDLPFSEYFPYSTKDAGFIGSYLMGVGFILHNLGLPKGSRVIEYGVGWGHVSAAMARAGFDVTCVDIEPKFLGIAARQAHALGTEIGTYEGEFGSDPYAGVAKADGAVFFEAFHHALNHLDVLQKLRRILRPGGRLILCGEPIDPNFPVPWGIRPDGHSLWAIRSFGWMELGFNEDYFVRMMLLNGFSIEKISQPELGTLGLLYRCTCHSGDFRPGESLLPADEAATWAPWSEQVCRFAQSASRLTLDSAREWRSVTVHAANYLSVPIIAAFHCGAGLIEYRFAAGERREVRLPLRSTNRELHIGSETRVPAHVGSGTDMRQIGIAVERVTYHDN